MTDFTDREFNTPAIETEYGGPRETEYGMPPEAEYSMPAEAEFSIPSENEDRRSEENGSPDGEDRKKQGKGRTLKKFIPKTILAVAAAVTVMTASLGIDIIGNDLIGTNSDGFILAKILKSTPSPAPSGTPGPTSSPAPAFSFPDLPNKDPDFAGDYAWVTKSPETSEEYLRLENSVSASFLEAGGHYKNLGVTETTFTGLEYDKTANTLTMEDFSASDLVLNANLMGNGFKLVLKGINRIGRIIIWGAMYGGSLTVTGEGTLIVNKDMAFTEGIVLQAESSQSCLMIDENVTVEIYGSNAAVAITDSLDNKGIYYPDTVKMTGGKVRRIKTDTGTLITVMSGDEYATKVVFGKK